MRVYYRCVLYEDIDTNEVPTDKAKIIANKLDTIGISKFDIIYQVDPEQPANYVEPEQEQQQQQ